MVNMLTNGMSKTCTIEFINNTGLCVVCPAGTRFLIIIVDSKTV